MEREVWSYNDMRKRNIVLLVIIVMTGGSIEVGLWQVGLYGQ